MLPSRSRVPSESTIEILSNHSILLEMIDRGNFTAWIIAPTRREEKQLGYDAATRNMKLVIIQYKAIQLNKLSVRVKIDRAQLSTLQAKFPAYQKKSYVFYCFSDYRTYLDLGNDFSSRVNLSRPVSSPFFSHSLFFDVHSIPTNCGSLNWNGTTLSFNVGGRNRGSITCWRGPQFVDGMIRCDFGVIENQLQNEQIEIGDRESDVSIPHLSIIHFNPNSS